MDAFTTAYITAALWSSCTDDGTPFDDAHSSDDIAPETLERMQADCAAFQAQNGVPGYGHPHYTDDEQAGHDFWLTRNGHGSGFWSREYLPADESKRYTDAAHAFGSFDLYLGDDGRIYGT